MSGGVGEVAESVALMRWMDLGVLWRMFAATLASSSGVSFRRDAYFAAFDYDHHLVDESAITARELEDLAGLYFPAFAVFALGVSAHRITGFGLVSHTIPKARFLHLPSLSSQAIVQRSKLGA
jgi:hypothetical protein